MTSIDKSEEVPPRRRKEWIESSAVNWGTERHIPVEAHSWSESGSNLTLSLFIWDDLCDLEFNRQDLSLSDQDALMRRVEQALVEFVTEMRPEGPFSFVVTDTKDISRRGDRPFLVPTAIEFLCRCANRWTASERDKSSKGLRQKRCSVYSATCPRCGRRLEIGG